ncbi:McrB family protein [Aeromonas caviae]|uniref:AAA family ATPase n=1 Tax=Aeromonas caviae TaxID=648 RepID=A0AA42V998_AERCA|nr:AAA family ATPase [Aeromonas caviae]MDH1896532.1 AAA family ATPase [Aeromonas caviae]WGY75005.1 AAA family ATPase [Aeromonas caviae]
MTELVEHMASSRATYLLTWNPEHYQEGGNAGVIEGREERWTCLSTKPKPGDRVFLIRLGVHPKGMVARGTVTQGSFEAPHWRDPSKTTRYIAFRAEETRANCAAGLLPMMLLEQLAQGAFKWSAQSSGIQIPPAVAQRLEKAWEAGRGHHSLAQCALWYRAQPEWHNDSWKPQYSAHVATLAAIKADKQPLDDATLDWLWREGDNGICTVSPGHLATAEYEQNIGLLRELAQLILQDPGRETYAHVFARWREAKNAGLFRQIYKAVLHRVFAAVDPARYTTLVKIDACRLLLERFARDFEIPTAKSDDWIELNQFIKAAMEQAGLPQDHPIDNNILAWRLYAAFTNVPASTDASDEPVNSQPATDTENKDPVMNETPLNQILFGPPGTGKTYHTINKALAILAPELLSKPGVTRDELKAAFDRYQQAGQVAFVTFHQSFSYEDFVEGIRALTREDGALEYKVESGVFGKLCEQARRGVTATEDYFEQALQVLLEQSEQAEDNLLLMHTTKGKPFKARYSGDKTFLIYPASNPDLSNGYSANMEHVRALYQTGEKVGYNPSYVWGMLDYLKQHCRLPAEYRAPQRGERKPFVLIIDEINRGNVSRIFGELITLIEPSKRAGADEALSTVLPYSKQPFSVPDNLYLIGTMNTADRSLAGLDIALRRRFVFEEMAPDPDLLKSVVVEADGVSIDVARLLAIMNQRIELLLDRDHCLGHAYFMPLKGGTKPTLAQLGAIFKTQILPLLQEYFFEDWQRIAWVLNDHRKGKADQFLQAPQVDVAALFGDQVKVGHHQRWTLNEEAFERIGAYAGIIEVVAKGGPAEATLAAAPKPELEEAQVAQ